MIPFKMTKSPLKRLQKVYFMGYPYETGQLTIKGALVINPSKTEKMQIKGFSTQPIDSEKVKVKVVVTSNVSVVGMSGGPLLNFKEELVGVTFGSWKKGRRSYFVRLKVVKDFLNQEVK